MSIKDNKEELTNRTESPATETTVSKEKNQSKEKKNKRLLKARRAIEDYFEDRHIDSLSGKRYWDALS